MMPPEELLQTPDWYDHDGSHRAISVAKGAVIGYWYGQPDWQPAERPWQEYAEVPVAASYAPSLVDDCCSAYGFRKGYRFRDNDYADRQSAEEIRRYDQSQDRHRHNPLAITRGTVIGYAYGREGNIRPERPPADLIRTCCAIYGFGQGFPAGNRVFFAYASEAEKSRYSDAVRAQRNEYGWG
jgi:hypothetical protein